MRVEELHGFGLSPAEARALQGELASRVVAGPALDLGGVRHVAGADVSTQGDRAYAVAVVPEVPSLSVGGGPGFEAALGFPYVAGVLSVRGRPSGAGGVGEGE